MTGQMTRENALRILRTMTRKLNVDGDTHDTMKHACDIFQGMIVQENIRKENKELEEKKKKEKKLALKKEKAEKKAAKNKKTEEPKAPELAVVLTDNKNE